MTAALEGGDWSAAGPGCTLPLGKTWFPFYRRLGWVGPRAILHGQKISSPTGIQSRTVHPIVSCYTGWDTRPTPHRRGSIKWRMTKWAEHMWHMVRGKGGTEIHTGLRYRELNRPTGRRRCRQDGNIEVDCQYIRQMGMDWVGQETLGFITCRHYFLQLLKYC